MKQGIVAAAFQHNGENILKGFDANMMYIYCLLWYLWVKML